MTAGILMLIVIPVVLALLIGVVVLFVRGGAATRWTIGTMAVLLVLLALPLLMLSWSSARVQHAQVETHMQRQEVEQRQAAIEAYNLQEERERRDREAHAAAGKQLVAMNEGGHGGSEAWRHAADHFLVADHYPSAPAAARGLAVEIEPLLDTVAPAGGEVTHVTIVAKDSVSFSVVQTMLTTLTERHPKLKVSLSDGNAFDSQQPIRIVLDAMSGGYNVQDERGSIAEGRMLEARVSGPGGSFSRMAAILAKPWVEDFNAFVSERDGGTYILAQSTEPALHAGEAQAMAIADAAQQITVHAQARLLAEERYGSINTTRLYQQIVVALNEGRFIEDRFVQAFERPGGKVYQAWLLIRADQGLLDQMAREQFIAARHQRHRYLSSGGGALVMFVVVLVLYGFLNAATKGYYATGLKVAAGTVVLLGVVWLALVA